MNSLPRIAIYVFDGVSLLHLAMPHAVFCDVKPLYDVTYFSDEAVTLHYESGLSIHVNNSVDTLKNADIVIIPGWHTPYRTPNTEMVEQVVAAHQRGATILGLCTGAAVLAAAGLLDGKRATTHWAFSQAFSYLFPDCELDENAIFIAHDKLVTSAGSTAAIDACIDVVRRDYGKETANSIARYLVMSPYREGGQSQYKELLDDIVQSDKGLNQVLRKIQQDLSQAHSIDEWAESLGVSRRTFTRRFRAHTGLSFGDWVLRARLRKAQYLLENSQLTIDDIANACGFGATTTFRHHFIRCFSVTPNRWRSRFQ